MGHHKHNPTAIAAKNGELPPKKRGMTKRQREEPIRTGPRKFYAAESGFADEFVVDYWNGSGIIVVTRDGKEWINGKLIEEVE